jgi:hypothetical protein
LERVTTARDALVAQAPVDDKGRYLDDGTWSAAGEAMGMIPVTVVKIDMFSLSSLESDVRFAVRDIVDEPALKLADGWYVTHDTSTRLGHLIDQVNEIHTRVSAVAPNLDVETPQDLRGVIDGAATIPATLGHPSEDKWWPEPPLVFELRSLADLNYASHRAEDHGKSWEPGFTIVRSGDQWTITFHSYQFEDPMGCGDRSDPHSRGAFREKI